MLRPQIPELIEPASSLDTIVTTTTNGTLIDKEKAKRLVEGGLRGGNISIDSPIRKMHEKILGMEKLEKSAHETIAKNFTPKKELELNLQVYQKLIG